MPVSQAIRAFLARNYLISLLVGWSTLISISVGSNLFQAHEDTISKAEIEAHTIFRLNIAYRKWSTMHGGIYTKLNEKNKGNPHYLYNIESGSEVFAIIDPSQVTRQAYEVLHNQAPALAAISHTVSLDYKNTIDPYDQPDAWEEASLKLLESGQAQKVSDVATINHAPYLRLLMPYVVDRGCISCHGDNFKVGNVQGGMSVAVPLTPYYQTAVKTERIIVITHLLLWLLGCLAIVRFSRAFSRSRDAIIESEKKFRIVSEFAYNFEYWLGQDNSLIFISPSCQRLTGYSREEFILAPHLLATIVHPEDRAAFTPPTGQDTARARSSSPPFRIITKDGQIRWFTNTMIPILVDGEHLGWRGSSTDITEQKHLEEQLARSRQLEYLGQFAGGIAHDFNNVLGSITTFAHLLKEEVKDSKTASDYIKYINIATKLGKNLTSNLLSFGKRQAIETEKTSLGKVITNISDILRSLVDESFHYQFLLDEQDLEITADPHQLEQVLINLCTNARDAMPGGGTITIRSQAITLSQDLAGSLEVIPAGRYMILSVSDTGHGIKPANIAKICEPFFTTKSSAKGTGLGLSIIFNIVKQHQGFLEVISAENQGATFSIYFKTTGRPFQGTLDPAEHPASQPAPPAPEETDRPRPPHPLAGLPPAPPRLKTILLADDDELIRKAIQINLERMGHQVLSAENGKQAIRLFLDQQQRLDLIILDVIMPQRNGKEVYEVIKANNPTIPVLFISGNTVNVMGDDFLNREGINFLRKPLDFNDFSQTVERLLSSR